MNKRLLSILQYIIFLGGGIFLVWWQLRGMTEVEKKEFTYAFNHANYWLIIPIIIMSLLSHLSRSYRWKLLLEPLDYKPKIINVFAVTMVGYLANSAVPRLGEILKCSLLARYEKLKVEKLVGSILVERTFDVICYLIFIALTILIQIKVIGNYAKGEIDTLTATTGLPIWAKLLLVISIILGIIFIIKLLFKKYPQNKIIAKTNSLFKGLGEGFLTIKNLKKRKLFLAHTIFIWSMYLLQIYVGFHAMDATAHLTIKAACSVLALATLAMIATPGGLGSFPFFIMQTLLVYGISGSLGKAFGWLIWGVSTTIVIIVGFICLMILPYLNKNKNENSTSHIE
jgi:glycosyltransferase 2 family protein